MHSLQRAALRHDQPYLIAAASGRPLAASARRGGVAAVVLDFFADADTASLGFPCRSVARPGELRFDPEALVSAADQLAPASACAGVVCGSGFERVPELISEISAGRDLLGNTSGVVERMKDPSRFFPLLDELHVPHPPVSLSPPRSAEGWLVKRRGSAAGLDVVPASRAAGRPDEYFQRYQGGRSLSALFLANGSRALLLGFNESHVRPLPGAPFLYGGGAGGIRLAAEVENDIVEALQRLTAAAGLVGLNGLDFILGEEGWFVLELNPRPTASIEYYDADWPSGLFAAHVAACAGQLPTSCPAAESCRGHAIVYAPQGFKLGPALCFPPWCRDLPPVGSVIPREGPVCTVHAEAPTPPAVNRLLARRRSEIECALMEQAA